MKSSFLSLTPILILALLAVLVPHRPDPPMQKIAPDLFLQMRANARIGALIVFPRDPLPDLSHRGLSKAQRGQAIYEALVRAAHDRQREVIAYLEIRRIPYRSFVVANCLYVSATPDQIREIATFRDVLRITGNPTIRNQLPVIKTDVHARTGPEIPWGLKHIHADSAWALGYEGEGVLIGGQDTGYDWTHPALNTKYQGWLGDTAVHDYHWHDAIDEINAMHGDSVISPDNNPCGLQVPEPCDDHGHGTHTMGTILGSEGDHVIGVAPKARWIGCRNMERGYGSPATYLACFEWFLAPTDLNNENPEPAKAPHIINNSWSCPEKEGCYPDQFHILETAVSNLRKAGILVVASAGNTGAACGTVSTPPAMFGPAFSVGAIRSNDTIAGFSSRGPVLGDSGVIIKPDLAAPGVGVYSARPDSLYSYASGTSMAGPHVAGVAALIISANPAIAGDVDAIEQILKETARPKYSDQGCGDLTANAIPNNSYGYGVINAFAAVQKAKTVTSSTPVPHFYRERIFPNPFSGTITISDIGKDLRNLRLVSASGMIFKQASIVQGIEQLTLHTTHLPAGIYFLHLDYMDHNRIVKVVKM